MLLQKICFLFFIGFSYSSIVSGLTIGELADPTTDSTARVDNSAVDAESRQQEKKQLLERIRKNDLTLINLQSSLKFLSDKLNDLEKNIEKLEKKIHQAKANIFGLHKRKEKILTQISALEKRLRAELKTLVVFFKSSQQTLYPNIEFFRNFFRNDRILKNLNEQTKRNLKKFKLLNHNLAKTEDSLNYAYRKLKTAENAARLDRENLYFEQEQKLIFLSLIKEEKEKTINQAELIDAQLKAAASAKKIDPTDTDKAVTKATADKQQLALGYSSSAVSKKANSSAKTAKNNTQQLNSAQGDLSQASEPNSKLPLNSLPVPIKGNILQYFGARADDDLQAYKRGVLISVDVAASKVKSVLSGRVINIKLVKDDLFSVLVEHEVGIYSLYAFLSKVAVKEDQKISADEVLGFIEQSNVIGSKIFYFELQLNYQAVDPLVFLAKNDWN